MKIAAISEAGVRTAWSAAATAVVVGKESAGPPLRFVADKPFLFFVRDLRTGHVLFMGRVADPAA